MLSNELMDLLQAMKKADRIILYGAGRRAKWLLPVCTSVKNIENILVTVTELETPMLLDEFEVKEIKDVNIGSNDLVCVAVGENYWSEIDKKLLEKGVSKVIKLNEDLILEAKKHILFEQCKNVGIDLRLLFGFAAKEIYSLFWADGDTRETTKSIKYRMWEIANEESTQYVMEHMFKARAFSDRNEYHNWVVSYLQDNIKESGINFEFGVATGISLRKFASYTKDMFYGFDSFEGFPEPWLDDYDMQDYVYGGALPPVPSNVQLIAGWFDETLPRFIEEKIRGGETLEKINFIHIDCDLYSSTKTVFENLGKYIKSGTIIAFDEYFNYPGWKEHEYKAFQEWRNEHHIEYEYLAYVENWSQVCIKIL